VEHAVAVADLAEARRLVLFHHEPDHDDDVLDGLVAQAQALRSGGEAIGGSEGMSLEV
jgi:phosphoribosyl 1,2-cyclic phosphodiesterase